MKTVVITGGTDGIGRGLALTYVDRGDRVVMIGTDPAKGENVVAAAPSMSPNRVAFIRADLELVDENHRVVDELTNALDQVDVLVLGARYQRSKRTETADGLESNFALTYLSRFLLSHGLIDLLARADSPVVLNFGGAGGFGPPRWDDLQQRTQYSGLTAMIQVAVSEGRAVPLDPRASSPADARRLYEYTQNVLAERPRSNKNIEVPER
ncbi:SDR family NAD(P)-dependent oxidoreductase [Nonomuraea sp. B12E4]|uniref:SDR family NAD(P)-dependent oxidoreductase n=1 Tax=Nonomuraea sp. B12E4 TaxID=3153564 RepID=UPI00325E6577